MMGGYSFSTKYLDQTDNPETDKPRRKLVVKILKDLCYFIHYVEGGKSLSFLVIYI